MLYIDFRNIGITLAIALILGRIRIYVPIVEGDVLLGIGIGVLLFLVMLPKMFKYRKDQVQGITLGKE